MKYHISPPITTEKQQQKQQRKESHNISPEYPLFTLEKLKYEL